MFTITNMPIEKNNEYYPNPLQPKYVSAILRSSVFFKLLKFQIEKGSDTFVVPVIPIREQVPFIELMDKILERESKNATADISDLIAKLDEYAEKVFEDFVKSFQ